MEVIETSEPTITIEARNATAGQWICRGFPSYNERIVEVETTRDGLIRIESDYGNGGEPATSFYEADESLRILRTH